MTRLLEEKVAIVTGGGRGIGRAVALALAGEGAAVVVNDLGTGLDGGGRDTSVAEAVVRRILDAGGRARPNAESIATMEGAQRMVEEALGTFGRLDILVACAGNASTAPLWEMTEEQWDTVVSVHLKGHFACTRAVAAPMRQQGRGRIVHITSHVGLYGHPEAANYAAAKAGITGLTRSAALALGPWGITVNAVAPSAVTRMSDTVPVEVLRTRAAERGIAFGPETSDEQIRLRTIGDPEAVGTFVAYLCTDHTDGVNGEIFAVAGGHLGRFAAWTEASCLDGELPWTVARLVETAPSTLLRGSGNPAPRAEPDPGLGAG